MLEKNLDPLGSLLPITFFFNLLYQLGFQGTHSSTSSAWMSFLHMWTFSYVCTSVIILFSCWVKWWTLEFFQGHHGLKVSQLFLSDTGHIHMSFLAGKHELCGKSSMWYLGSNFHLSVASTWLTKLYVLTLCVQCWICGHCTSSWEFTMWTQNNHAPLMMLSMDLGCLTPSYQCTQLILSDISHSWGKVEPVCNYIPHHCSLFHLKPCCCELLFLILDFLHMSRKPCRCGDWSNGPI